MKNKIAVVKDGAAELIKGAFSPSSFISELPRRWYLYLIIPVVTFLFFFLQAGLDRASLATASAGKIVLMCFFGLLFGAVFTFFESGAIKLLCRATHVEVDFKQLTCGVCLTFVFPLIINLLGVLLCLIFKMNTSLAFCLSGILLSFVFLYDIFMRLEIGGVKNRKLSSVFGVSVLMMLGLSAVSLLMMF